MIRLSVLASSSRGNATVISGGNTHLLVDAGISALRIRRGLADCGLSVPALSGIFITHEHHDHTCGLGILSKKDELRLFCSRYLAPDLKEQTASRTSFTYMEPGAAVRVGDFTVTSFCVSHDAIDPVGYLFECGGVKLGYITDTGCIKRGMKQLLAEVDALYLESNYDPEMLDCSGRAPELIDRISGTWGHLSNEQAGDFVRSIAHPGLQHIVLAHLSPECNTPAIATRNMQEVLDELHLPTRLHCARQAERLPWVEIKPKLTLL